MIYAEIESRLYKIADYMNSSEMTLAIESVRKIYLRHSAGCCLHILLEDGNVEDHHVEFCAKEAQKAGHSDCIDCCEALYIIGEYSRYLIVTFFGDTYR